MDKKLSAISKKKKKIKNMEDDPVVKEIPVYLSKTLANELYVIQYPLYYKGYDNTTVNKISMKPKNQKFRMEFLIDTQNTESYDRRFGEELVLNAESESKGTDENEQITFNSGLMDKIVLASEGTLPNISNYAVGIFQDGELHITPLKNMLRMKIQYDYLDESDKRVKEGTKIAGEDDDEDEDNPSPVKVTFARPPLENVKKKQSFHQHSKKTQEEHWIHTNYIPPYDPQAELTQMEMFCPSPESLSASNVEPLQYVQQLMSQVPEARYLRSSPEDQLDLHYILTMPLLDQIRIIMKRVRIISFSRLCQLLSPEHEPVTILKYLQQVALLVQGNWVVNSELLYPKDAQSDTSELMCKARDHILLLFIEQQFVNYNMLSSFIKLQQDEIDKIFAGIATYVPKKGWRLNTLPDWSFYESHPEVAQRQKVFWDAKQKLLREMLETQNQLPQRQRRKSHRESIGSENEERNVGRGRKSLRDSSLSDNDSTAEPTKHKKSSRSRKVSETT
ncbi:hypothetical protein DMN91_006874 [Ooceraea biroi]|uniref:DNA-directed RNA polymerase III subunit RPC5 n=1 Tax=Ooceraea biroi TaxID=2015173 RepID=A0A026WFL9_OOCBI|nr:DNA-directed RNA polymerase III subunit RPC5 [Ooceraea biroi]EZA54847.1 DNA-directed RNA polymerase III subunit RPC5 [Ooceraea biroi]RLU20267.1 hypothetical protein DMN91_006874 [Ooceraea biroi]